MSLLGLDPRMAKPFLVEKAPIVWIVISIFGLVLTLLGVFGLSDSSPFGGWGLEYLLLLVGAILVLGGAVLLFGYLARVRKFHELLSERKKAEFIKNLDDIEYLAWRLPLKFERELVEKKRELGMR